MRIRAALAPELISVTVDKEKCCSRGRQGDPHLFHDGVKDCIRASRTGRPTSRFQARYSCAGAPLERAVQLRDAHQWTPLALQSPVCQFRSSPFASNRRALLNRRGYMIHKRLHALFVIARERFNAPAFVNKLQHAQDPTRLSFAGKHNTLDVLNPRLSASGLKRGS